MSNQFVASFAVVMLILVNLFVVALYVRLLKRRSRLALLALEENPSSHRLHIRRLEMEMKMMPVFVYSKAASTMTAVDGGYVTECAVCLGDFKENDSCQLLPLCKHWFHTQCIDMWFSSHSNCPLCRASVLQDPNNTACDVDGDGDGFIDENGAIQDEAHTRIEIAPPPVAPALPISTETPPSPPPEQEVHIALPSSSSHNNFTVDNSLLTQSCNSFKLLLISYLKTHN